MKIYKLTIYVFMILTFSIKIALSQKLPDKTPPEIRKLYEEFKSQTKPGTTDPDHCKAGILGKTKRGSILHSYGLSLDKNDIYKSDNIFANLTVTILPEFKEGEQFVQSINTYAKIKKELFIKFSKERNPTKLLREFYKTATPLHTKQVSSYYNAEAELLKIVENQKTEAEVVTKFIPALPFCISGNTIHTVKYDKIRAGIEQTKIIWEVKNREGYWHYKSYLFDDDAPENKGIKLSTDRYSFDSKLGWINSSSSNFLFDHTKTLNKEFPKY